MYIKYFITLAAMSIFIMGCTGVRRVPDNGMDIKGLSLQKGLAFDIRILKDIYGEPAIIDPSSNALIYTADYHYYDSTIFSGREPEKSERWYLALTPSDVDKFYYGEKFVVTQMAQRMGSGDAVYASPPRVESLMDIREIADRKK